MCITLHASKLSGTRIYAGEALRDGVYVHVLAYQNKASNLQKGPNAMILPLPAKGVLSADNAIDTRTFKGFLDDIANSTKNPAFGRRGAATNGSRGGSRALVFDVGSYTVVLAQAHEVSAALERVSANKRPTLNSEVLASFGENYPEWPLAVCCWDGEIEPEPLLFWYEPRNPEMLFAPSLDAHDGRAPSEEPVLVDTIVSFGSTISPTGRLPIRYRNPIPDQASQLLPERAVGELVHSRLPNGDFWYRKEFFTGETAHAMPIHSAHRFFPNKDEVTPIELGLWC